MGENSNSYFLSRRFLSVIAVDSNDFLTLIIGLIKGINGLLILEFVLNKKRLLILKKLNKILIYFSSSIFYIVVAFFVFINFIALLAILDYLVNFFAKKLFF